MYFADDTFYHHVCAVMDDSRLINQGSVSTALVGVIRKVCILSHAECLNYSRYQRCQCVRNIGGHSLYAVAVGLGEPGCKTFLGIFQLS